MRSEPHLRPRPANYRPLTPVDLLIRALDAHPAAPAVVWRDERLTWSAFGDVVLRLVAALKHLGPGDVVSVMCPNRPEMLAAHFAVPALGAVLNAVNTRLDADAVAWILDHCESRLLIADPANAPVATAAARAARVPLLILAEDGRSGDRLALLEGPAPATDLTAAVTDEWQPIALNYTSGTTGHPKGVVMHHRGAYLNALGNVAALGLSRASHYLWTLPMFHCNGWSHTWAVTAAGGVHVCLERVDPAEILARLEAERITHMSCAPVVLYMLLNHPAANVYRAETRVTVASGGAAPTDTLIRRMGELGFDFLHLYGMTESYGPTSMKDLDSDEAGLDPAARATLLARQGVRHTTANGIAVVAADGTPVPRDGETVGEIVLRGNTLTAGYYRDAEATEAAFEGGVFHTGDLAVVHPNGDIEIRDRAKDVIITGGENVSSLEIEAALHRHPDIVLAAVVARPHQKWGETPMAFIEARDDAVLDPAALVEFCGAHLAGFKIPRAWAFGELPKTATGKIQKFLLRDRARTEAADD